MPHAGLSLLRSAACGAIISSSLLLVNYPLDSVRAAAKSQLSLRARAIGLAGRGNLRMSGGLLREKTARNDSPSGLSSEYATAVR